MRARLRRRAIPPFLLLLLVAPASAAGQSAAVLAPDDPVYHDLARLEAMGLVPGGTGSAGPWSVARVARLVRDAGGRVARLPLSATQRGDARAILDRLGARFPAAGTEVLGGALEVEVGGGRSPGRITPDRGLGDMDAVVNPLWMGTGGRPFGDRSTLAVAGRIAVPLGSRVALMAGGRGARLTSSGATLWDQGWRTEALALRARLGAWALEVGRDRVWAGDGSTRALALGGSAPPLDLVRLGTDEPLYVHVLGEVDVTLFAADLGRDQTPSHPKLFGVMATSRPASGVELGLILLNKQFGEGAPEVGLVDRLIDLTWVLDWLRPGVTNVSDKLAQVSVRLRPAAGTVLFGEALLTDFDHRRPRHTFQGTAGYRAGVELSGLGSSGRHALGVEATWLGPDVYLHHAYESGHVARGFPLGSYLGPDSRAVHVDYGYHPAARGWWVELGLTADEWRGDNWRPGDEDEDGPERLVDGPSEIRLRADVSLHAILAGGRAGVDARLGLERVRNFDFRQDLDRRNGAAVLRLWHAF